MTVKIFNQQVAPSVVENIVPMQNSVGMSIIQCGWDYLYVGNYNQPIAGGSLWKLDPLTGAPVSRLRTSHTIATGLPTTSYMGTTNDQSNVITGVHNGQLYMYLFYYAWNNNIVYRGAWNEENLRFENFQPFVTFNTGIAGRYTSIANIGTNEIAIIGTSSLQIARFNPSTGNINQQPTGIGGTWSPSSYNFGNAFYSNGRLVGASGDGTNWYRTNMTTSEPPASFNPQSDKTFIQGFNFAGTAPFKFTPSDFYPVVYYFETNGEIRTYLASTDTRFTNPKWSEVSRTWQNSYASKSYPFPKKGEGLDTAKIGNLIIKQDIDNVQEIQANNNLWSADVLVGQNNIYRMYSNMSVIEIYSKNPDGSFKDYIKTVNWQSMDSRIDEIHVNNSSQPTAYALFISGGVEYLVGWSRTNSLLHVWKINADGSITYYTNYAAPTTMSVYGRGGWDGGSYVYFYNRTTRVIYRWTILSSTVSVMCTLDDNYSIDSSYTGSGMLVRNGYIYIPQAVNENDNYVAMGVWRLSDGVIQSVLPYYSLYSHYKSGNSGNGGIQLTPLHNKAYAISTILGGRIITFNIEWDNSNFYTKNSHIAAYEMGEGIENVPREYRSVGNKSINKMLQVIDVPQASEGFSNVLVGKSKVYLQTYLTWQMHIFNKNADGTLGSYIGSKDWTIVDTLTQQVMRNAPTAGAMYVDSNGVDHFVGFENTVNGRIFDWVINADGSLGARTDYASKYSFLISSMNTDAVVGNYKRAGWDGGRYIYVIGFDTNADTLFRWDITTKGNLEYIGRIAVNYGTSSYTYTGLLVEDDYIYWSPGANSGMGSNALFAYNRNPTEKQPYPLTYPESMINARRVVDASGINKFENVSSFDQEYAICHIGLTALHPTKGYGIWTSPTKATAKVIVMDIEGDQPPSAPGVEYKTYKFGSTNEIRNKADALAIGFQDWSILTGSPNFSTSGGAIVGDGSAAMWGGISDAYYNGKAGLNVTTASAIRFKAPRAGLYRFKVALRSGETGRVYDVTNNKVVSYFTGNQITTVYYNMTKDQVIDFIEDGNAIVGIFEISIPEEPVVSLTEINAGLSVDSLSRLTVSWKKSFDFEGDPILYDLELYNGSQWMNIGTTEKLNHSPIIPSLNITNARLRVRARGTSGSASNYVYSNTFIIKPAPANAPTPNALIFDGIDDSIIAYSTPFVTVGTGDFTIEMSFRTTSKEKMYLFNGGIAILIEDGRLSGTNIDPTVDQYNDGTLYHVAYRRTGTTVELIVNGIVVGTGTYNGNLTSLYNVAVGSTTSKTFFFQGILSLPRFWNDARTLQELKTYANATVPDSEQGLIDYMLFDPSTTKLRAKKTSNLSIDMLGGIQWSFKFVGVDSKLPFPGQFQRRENLIYLREKVNELRLINGLSPVQWSEPFIISGQTPIKAVHWNEIEDGILEIYDMNSIEFTTPSVEKQLRQDIKPRDTAYQINGLVYRINNILKALKNQ